VEQGSNNSGLWLRPINKRIVASQGSTAAVVTYSDTNEHGIQQLVVGRAAFATRGELTCYSNLSSAGTFSEGHAITVTVIDPDLDQVSTLADEVGLLEYDLNNAVMFYGHAGDLEIVSLKETAAASGVFTGVIETTGDVGSDHTGKLLTSPAFLVSATYSDAMPQSLSECFVRVRSIGEISASSDNVLPLHTFTVTVTDADLNTDIYLAETSDLKVTDGFGTFHDVQLLETGLDSSHFTAALQITLNPSAANLGVQSNAEPNLFYLPRINEVLPMAYNDRSPEGLRTPLSPVRVGHRGLLQAHPPIVSSVASSTGAHGINITVTDSDLNIDANTVQQHTTRLKVSAVSGSTILRTVAVTLTETSVNASTFTGFLSSKAFSAVTDLSIEIGLQYLTGISASPLIIEYQDPTAGVVMQPSVTLQTERRGQLEITQTESDTGKFGIGGRIIVILKDKDLDVSNKPDTVSVVVTCSGSAAADSETLTLTETFSSSGLFTGSLGTQSTGTSTVDDGIVAPVSSGNVVTAAYSDQAPLGHTATGTITAGFIGLIAITPSQILTSSAQITITLTDHDLNENSGVAETYAASKEYLWYSIGDSTKTYLDITEDAVDSAQFTKVVMLPSGSAAGSRLTVTYMDPEIGGKGAVRNAVNKNPSSTILAFGTNGAENNAVFSLTSAGILWRSPECPADLIWAASCGPTTACKDDDLCGATMSSDAGENAASLSEFRLAAGSALTVTVQDLDRNLDSIVAETVYVTVRNEQSTLSLAAYGAAQNPYCATARDECYLGPNDKVACSNDGDCPGGSCVKRGCFHAVRRREEEPLVAVILTETGLNTALFSGIIYTRDSPEINTAGDNVVHVGVGDIMSVTYSDSPSLGSSAGANRTRLVRILKTGKPAILTCPSEILAGGKMKIMLSDLDLIGAATASVKVRVIAGDGRLRNDEEAIVLTAAVSDEGTLSGFLQVSPRIRSGMLLVLAVLSTCLSV
jgi:hypothetical protein